MKRLYPGKDERVVGCPGKNEVQVEVDSRKRVVESPVKNQKFVLDKSSLDNAKGRVVSCPSKNEVQVEVVSREKGLLSLLLKIKLL